MIPGKPLYFSEHQLSQLKLICFSPFSQLNQLEASFVSPHPCLLALEIRQDPSAKLPFDPLGDLLSNPPKSLICYPRGVIPDISSLECDGGSYRSPVGWGERKGSRLCSALLWTQWLCSSLPCCDHTDACRCVALYRVTSPTGACI